MKTKLILSAVAALLAGVSAASAADLAARPYTKAPVAPMVAIYNWGGFYIGGNVGAGALTQTLDNEFVLPPSDILRYSGTGSAKIVGGVHGGYNFVLSPNFLVGVEGGYTFADLSQSDTQVQVSGLQRTEAAHIRDLWDVVGRAGFTANNWLIYARGGYAGTKVDLSLTRTSDGLLQLANSKTVNGYVVGGGVEWGLSPNWILGVEGNYYNFGGGDRLLANIPPTVPSNFRNVTTEVVTGVARLSYKFGGPVVAKY